MLRQPWYHLIALFSLLAVLCFVVPGPAVAPPSKKQPKEITNSIGMKLVLIPPGKFKMGSTEKERKDVLAQLGVGLTEADMPESLKAEGPQHEVEITQPFYLGMHEVTQAQYKKVMGTNPSYYSTEGEYKDKVTVKNTNDFPVECVTWVNAVKFCEKLSALTKEKAAGRKYRLPTEAEWEYAARAGTTTPFHYGTSLSSKQANFNGTKPFGGAAVGPYLERPCKVGSYKPNAFGLYDMHGNVMEWCSDRFGQNYYASSPRRDPTGPVWGWNRVVRGGSYDDWAQGCRSAWRRLGARTTAKDYRTGIRVALSPPGE